MPASFFQLASMAPRSTVSTPPATASSVAAVGLAGCRVASWKAMVPVMTKLAAAVQRWARPHLPLRTHLPQRYLTSPTMNRLGQDRRRRRRKSMSIQTPERAVEPKPLIPALEPFYQWVRELSWPLIRLTVGGTLLVHGIVKLMGPGIAVFAQNSMARRGIEPALLVAYLIYFLETVGATAIMVGLFTRFFAAAIAIELAVITFAVDWHNGYGSTRPGGGWEYPLL